MRSRNLRNLIKDKSIKYAIVTMLLWGIYWTLIRIPIERIGWFWASYCYYAGIIAFPLLRLVKPNPIPFFKERKTLYLIILVFILTLMANFGFNLGLTFGYSSIVAPIAGASPVVFVIISRLVFREKLTRLQGVGIILTLLGILIIGISSV